MELRSTTYPSELRPIVRSEVVRGDSVRLARGDSDWRLRAARRRRDGCRVW